MSERQSFPGSAATRRQFLKSTAALGLASATLAGFSQSAWAMEQAVKAYGVTTAQLRDWSIMSKSAGVQVDFVPTNSDIGIFMRDVMGNNLGATTDVFIFEGGTEDVLGPQGIYAELDESHPELTLWERTHDDWKRSDLVRANDKQYGVMILGNADSFGYFPEAIGANPNGEDEISWAEYYEGDAVKGRVSFDRTWAQSLPETANFLKEAGRIQLDDPADLTPEQAKAVVDYLIERKKAGHFRTIHSSFEEQVQLLISREVDMINCWEPAIRDANASLGEHAVRYAYTKEGYYKWGHGAYISAQAVERGNIDAVYRFLNYLLGGEYHAYQARDRGYPGPNMDLAIAYAKENNWSAAEIADLEATAAKLDRKYTKPFFAKTVPENSDAMESEWQRFLNA